VDVVRLLAGGNGVISSKLPHQHWDQTSLIKWASQLFSRGESG